MMHSPIQLQDIALSFPHKVCFEGLTTRIHPGCRIAIIGDNGCGKSTLLKILQGTISPTSGSIKIPDNVRTGYVPQVIEHFEDRSGGERLNKALTQALSVDPNLLLLDEPTNHLDRANRKSLMRLLRAFQGTLVVVSHDIELLRNSFDTFWLVDNGQVHRFSGHYDDLIRENEIKRNAIEKELISLNRQKKTMHQALMKEQVRAAKSRDKGEKSIDRRKWPTIVSKTKASNASETSNRKKLNITLKKEALCEQLSDLGLPEVLRPKFSLCAQIRGDRTIVMINEGCAGYGDKAILRHISLSLATHERIAILGSNGSGKSTLVKAIMNDAKIIKLGNWYTPKPQDIGYLDQHYGTLDPDKSVFESIQELMPTKSHTEIRYHLNDFLFRKSEEVNVQVSTLSGGEKVRLTLAQIAAKPPKLLILDEVTNNLDIKTRAHVVQVLQAYPGAMIVVSHDKDFLRSIGIIDLYNVEDWSNC